MAELSLLANIAQVVGAGLGLSKLLYDFAATLGSASRDVKSLATNISLFCSVLGHVNSTLSRGKSSRLSLSAIRTAEEVVDQCRIIFAELEQKILKLQKGDTQLDLVSRVKWYFQEKHILLVHEQLRTCSATLHLMLTTLVLAEKIATRRFSNNSNESEEDQDRQLTHSLFLAQQAAQESLVETENEVLEEEFITSMVDSRSPSSSSSQSPMLPQGQSRSKHRRNLSSRVINGALHSPTDFAGFPPFPAARISVVLGRHLNRLSVLEELPTIKQTDMDYQRLSLLQTDRLIRHWTTSSAECVQELDSSHDLSSTMLDQETSETGLSATSVTNIQVTEEIPEYFQTLNWSIATEMQGAADNMSETNNAKPKEANAHPMTPNVMPDVVPVSPFLSRDQSTHPLRWASEQAVSNEGIEKTSIGVRSEEFCETVTIKALKKCGITEHGDYMHLFLVSDDGEYRLRASEKPFQVIDRFASQGKNPHLKLRRLRKTRQVLRASEHPRGAFVLPHET